MHRNLDELAAALALTPVLSREPQPTADQPELTTVTVTATEVLLGSSRRHEVGFVGRC